MSVVSLLSHQKPLSLLMSFFMQKAGNENFSDIYKLNSLLLILRTLLSNSRIQEMGQDKVKFVCIADTEILLS